MSTRNASTASTTHVAIDLGAESGRVMLGRVGERIELEEVHRWPSRRVRIMGSERWNILFMWAEILEGLKLAAAKADDIASVSVDSWGVDYVYEAQGGHPYLTPPHMYRDPRVDPVFERVAGDGDLAATIYSETGIQFLPFNTLYQLLADRAANGGEDLQDDSYGFLFIADYFNMLLSGAVRAERSLASTSQLYNPATRGWSDRLIGHFNFLPTLFPKLVDAGDALGNVTDEVAELSGVPMSTRVVATCSHDTGNAVAATPLSSGHAYLSSGTWSLLGVEAADPVTTEVARKHNFTNEVGYGHSIRLLKNLSGLFLVQESRKNLPGDPTYAELAEAAYESPAARSLIRPDAPQFGRPGGMLRNIRDYCSATDQPVPETAGQVVRCCYESLALLYAETFDQLADITGERPTGLNIVGGGSKIGLLNQLAADACGVPVEAGPAEATAIGNVGIQAIAAGTVADLPALRQLVRESFDTKTYQPAGDLAAMADRFAALPNR